MSSTFTPRLATSRQWTDLPAEFLSKVREVFDNQFEHETLDGEFLVEGRIYPDETLVRVGYLEKGRLKQINFEASMDLQKAHDDDEEAQSKTMERLYVCIDALGSLMEEYFQLGGVDDMDVPTVWRAYEFEGETVFLQHSTLNTRLEEEADRILGLIEKQLFHEEALSEDALKKAEIDSDLAFEIQKEIRAGKYPLPQDAGPESDNNLN